jgi:hypothetical protein
MVSRANATGSAGMWRNYTALRPAREADFHLERPIAAMVQYVDWVTARDMTDGCSSSSASRSVLDGRSASDRARSPGMMPPPTHQCREAGDHFGQYVLTISCTCGHTRTAHTDTRAVRRLGRTAGRRGQPNALLEVWRTAMQCGRAPRDEAQQLRRRADYASGYPGSCPRE